MCKLATIDAAKEAIDLIIEAGCDQKTGLDTEEDCQFHQKVAQRFIELFVQKQQIRNKNL